MVLEEEVKMAEQLHTEDLDKWVRDGRGRELQFYATDEEVQYWLLNALPREYEPYYLVGADRVKEDRLYIERPFHCEIGKFLQCMRASESTRYNFWIWSPTITPDLPLHQGMSIDKLCSYNGLVLLQHGLMVEDRRDPSKRMCREASRIAIADRVRNLESGAIQIHHNYLRVFEELRRMIKRSLAYASVVRDRQGRERESRLHMWTEEAMRSYLAGYLFWDSPGQLVGKRKERKGI